MRRSPAAVAAAADEGHTLIHSAHASAGDITVTGDELCVTLEPLSPPHRTQALVALCETVNEAATSFPGPCSAGIDQDAKPDW